jgi:hypothetical protein
MAKLPEEILFDVRLIERHIRQGLTTRAEYEAYIKKLADAADQRDVIDMDVLANGRAPEAANDAS